MRRAILALGLAGSALFLSGCSTMFYGVVGEDVSSSHQDGGVVGGSLPFRHMPGSTGASTGPQKGLTTSFVGEFRLEKEWDYDYAAHVLGGMRFQNNSRFKWPYFYEVTGGWTHYPGQDLFTLHPNFGFMIPLSGHSYQIYARLGLPIYFFSGETEVGTEFTAGLSMPLKWK